MLACIALGGCASEAEEPLIARSSTPRITVGPAAADVESLLVSDDDVRAVDGFGGAVAADLGDLEVYENPDPRGPCGTRVDPTPTPDGGRGFTTEAATVVQFVYADAGMVEGHMEALADDLRPGCGSHESVTNVGAVQEVSEPVPIDTTGMGDRAIGWTATITVSDVTAEAGLVVVVAGERATILQLLAEEVDVDQLVSLARAAAERLE